MTRTSAIRNISVPEWGGLDLGSIRPSKGEAAERRRRSLRWSGPGEVAVGALLVVLWAMLWVFFISGVVEPAAGMQARSARPRVDVTTGLPVARGRADPGPVDTTGGVP